MCCLTFWQYFYLPTLSAKHLGTTTCSLLAGSRVGEVGTRLKIPSTHRFNRRLPSERSLHLSPSSAFDPRSVLVAAYISRYEGAPVADQRYVMPKSTCRHAFELNGYVQGIAQSLLCGCPLHASSSRAWLSFPPHRVARYEKRGRGDSKIDLWWGRSKDEAAFCTEALPAASFAPTHHRPFLTIIRHRLPFQS